MARATIMYSYIQHSGAPRVHSGGPSICYVGYTTLSFGFSYTASACTSVSLSLWMKKHHLQLNLSKSKFLVIPAQNSIWHNISINSGSATVAPTKNLGGHKRTCVMVDGCLPFSNHITLVAKSCCFAMFNIKKIRWYLTSVYATQPLVQAMVLSCHDCCNFLLATCLYNQTTVNGMQCGGTLGILSTQKGTCYFLVNWSTLATVQ